jgi:hypothetical protein
VPLTDTSRARKNSSTPVAPHTTAEKGADDKNKSTTNRNLAQGKGNDDVRTSTSYFDEVWNAFSKQTDGSKQWIPKQIVAIGEDYHSQVGDGKIGDGKVRTFLYNLKFVGKDTTRKTTPGSPSRISAGAPPDEDPFEKQMRLRYESEPQAEMVQRYDKSQALDQLEEWMKENPIPYIPNDKFCQEVIFHYWVGSLSGHALSLLGWASVRARMSLGCGPSSMVVLHQEVG